MKNMFVIIALLIVALVSGGCGHSAGQYQPIVDGPKDEKYFTDLKQCQQLAGERSYVNDDVKTTGLLGAGLGALAGGVEGGVEGAIVGTVVGSALGVGARSWGTRDEKKDIVIECMRLRDNRVVETTGRQG